MLKRLVNECLVTLEIRPTGPILVKSGGSTVTGPDMAFVRVWRNGAPEVYLPGSSLKGVFRSHAERIARSIAPENETIACDPFAKQGPERSCGDCFERRRPDHSDGKDDIPEAFWLPDLAKEPDAVNRKVYAQSCAICRLFGSTWFAGRIATADGYAIGNPPGTQTRDGVGIDRFTGGAARGAKFDLEVVTGGVFTTTLHIRNFELWQLGLLGFILQDLKDERLRVGSGKSRGLGQVAGTVTDVEVHYLGRTPEAPPDGGFAIWGMDAFGTVAEDYGLRRLEPVIVDVPQAPRNGLRVTQRFAGEAFPWDALAKSWVTFASAYEAPEAMTYFRTGAGSRA